MSLVLKGQHNGWDLMLFNKMYLVQWNRYVYHVILDLMSFSFLDCVNWWSSIQVLVSLCQILIITFLKTYYYCPSLTRIYIYFVIYDLSTIQVKLAVVLFCMLQIMLQSIFPLRGWTKSNDNKIWVYGINKTIKVSHIPNCQYISVSI